MTRTYLYKLDKLEEEMDRWSVSKSLQRHRCRISVLLEKI